MLMSKVFNFDLLGKKKNEFSLKKTIRLKFAVNVRSKSVNN